MKLRSVLTLLLILLIAAGFGLPDFLPLPGIDFSAFPLEFPISAMTADAEVQSVEELEAVMKAAIGEAKESVKVRIISYDEKTYDINRLFKKVLEENAGLGFVSGCNASITRTFESAPATLELKVQYRYPVETVIAMRESADSKAAEITGKIIKPGMSDYEKVQAIHDYIIKNSVYDSVNANKDTVPAEGHEAYGVLVDGTGVCDSYAKAFKLLSDKAGVQCMLVEGSKAEALGQNPGSTDHAWNIVFIEGEYYHIDATWDDVSEDRDSDELAYHYFNLNDGDMQKTHVWDRTRYPACTGTSYNYYVYNELYADDYQEAVSMLAKTISAKEEKLMMKISKYNSATYNIERMLKRAVEESRLKRGISAKWIINDPLGIIDIEFEY